MKYRVHRGPSYSWQAKQSATLSTMSLSPDYRSGTRDSGLVLGEDAAQIRHRRLYRGLSWDLRGLAQVSQET